jgi:hypothetical protein
MNTATQTAIELHATQVDVSSRTAPQHAITPFGASHIAETSEPEGGYGWVVLFSCGVITFWFVGTTYCWGVIQGALVKEGLSSPATLSFVGSLTTACLSILALASSKALRTLGARNTGLLGIVCLGTGEILGGFTTKNVGGLFVTIGLIMGVGVSLSFIVSHKVLGRSDPNESDGIYSACAVFSEEKRSGERYSLRIRRNGGCNH